MNKHIEGVFCPSCNEKLEQADEELKQWFLTKVKPKFLDAHISWSFRDEKTQNEFLAMGKTKAAWPKSAHNHTREDGKPSARAIDLFELCSNGMARFAWSYYRQIADMAAQNNDPILWGGNFHSIGDADHFQLK